MLCSGTFSINCCSAADPEHGGLESEAPTCRRSGHLLCLCLCTSLTSPPMSSTWRNRLSWQDCWLFTSYSDCSREHQLIASSPEGILAKKHTLTFNYLFSLLGSYIGCITGYSSCLSKDLLWDTSSRIYPGYHLKYRPCCFDSQERSCHWKLILL